MDPNTVRTFAAGLLVATSICGAVYLLGSNEETAPVEVDIEEEQVDQEGLTEEEMVTLLSANGYVVQTEEEWALQLQGTEQQQETSEAVEEEPEEDTTSSSEENVIYRTIVTVSPGMTSIDVGRALESANIIDSSSAFFREVEDRGLANELRPGSFEVESNMSMGEIISLIFQ